MTRPLRTLLTLSLLAAYTPTPTLGDEPRDEPPAILQTAGTFLSQGKTIRVERFEPRTPGPHPGVLVLHGSAGMTIGGATFRATARALAERGFVAHIIHYFDATGTKLADRRAMIENFPTWLKVTAEALSGLSRQPNVDPNRLGLVGFSLGAYLSLSLAIYDHRVSAVVDYFGGLPGPLANEIKGFPPTLILHGANDRVVPPSEARNLESVFKKRGIPHEITVYPNQGHGFLEPAASDAVDRTIAFLEAHVKTSPIRKHEVARPRLDRLEAIKSEVDRVGIPVP